MSDVTLPSYPHDPTGTLVACKITGEQQILTGANYKDYYTVIPNIAPIFRKNFQAVLKNGGNSRPLDEHVDFDFVYEFIGASRSTAEPVFGGIEIKNTSLTGVLELTYQTLGGDWVIDSVRIAQILSDKTHNPRITSWEVVAHPPYAYPPIDHEWDLVDMKGLTDVVESIGGIEQALRERGTDGLDLHESDYSNPHRVTATQVGAYTFAQADIKSAEAAATAIRDHAGQADPHSQYTTDAEVKTMINAAIGLVRQPKNIAPAAQATNISQTATLIGSAFQSLYGLSQTGAQFQVSNRQDFSSTIVDSGILGAVAQYAITSGLSANSSYFWRCRHRDAENVWSEWSVPTVFATGAVLVSQPSITSPTPGQTGVPTAAAMTSSAFTVTGGVDTHASSDWEIWTGANGTGTKAYGVAGSTGSKTSLNVPSDVLSPNTPYYARVRYNGNVAGTSAWSPDVNFTTSGVVRQPTISSPLPAATNVSDQPTITMSAFAVTGGTDTHASSDYQVWTGPNGTGTKVFELLNSTTDKLSTVITSGKLAVSTTYYVRVRQKGTVLGLSAWSTDVQFTTASSFVPTTPGAPYLGGYYFGRIKDGADVYALIVSPKSAGSILGVLGDTRGAIFRNSGLWNTDRIANTNASAYNLARTVRALTIGGYNDWYIPAIDELELMYRNLKPSADANIAGSGAGTDNPEGKDGINLNSVPAGAAYTASVPGQTTLSMFKSGGSESLEDYLMSSTWHSDQNSDLNYQFSYNSTQYITQGYSGNQRNAHATGNWLIRAIRRVKINP